MFYGSLFSITFCTCILSINTREQFAKLMNENIVLLGIIGVIVSLPVVILHNKWDNFYASVVSALAWMGLLKNFIRMLNIPILEKNRNKKLNDEKSFLFFSYIGTCIGFFLIFLALMSNK